MSQAHGPKVACGGAPDGGWNLLVIWRYPGGAPKIVVELKILHKGLERTLAEGLEQTGQYLDRAGERAGHLVMFDRSDRPWEEEIHRREETYGGRRITVGGVNPGHLPFQFNSPLPRRGTMLRPFRV